jgi:methionyl-tRNA synthetase
MEHHPPHERKFYVSTPIYYVNDRPHIGHVYTTAMADVLARYHRLMGDDVFFLTGTDEHATKVVDEAAKRGLSPKEWADRNAEEFEQTFKRLGFTHDDFIRTSQQRHTDRVKSYVQALQESGDVYLGEYEGWYDAGQEEYIPENKAKEQDYVSAITKKPLIRRKEENYFFRLSGYADDLLKLLEEAEDFVVSPVPRRNEIAARIREGLNDVPMSRTGAGGWGIPVPGDERHTIYVWIDALFNYLTAVDTDERRDRYWPCDVHLIGKDILWFHAAIWPAMLLALSRQSGYEWVKLPRRVHAHSFWLSEGMKMGKSLGNFIDLENLEGYIDRFGLDALRYYLTVMGPFGATDGDFAEAKFLDLYNADLANTVGNSFSRVSNMTAKYFDGKLPEKGPHVETRADYSSAASEAVRKVSQAVAEMDLSAAAEAAVGLVRSVDAYIEETQPFKMAKDPEKLPAVGTVLYNCAESLRIASLLLWPLIPGKMEALWERIGCDYAATLAEGQGNLSTWAQWGQLQPGTPIVKGEALFPRMETAKK